MEMRSGRDERGIRVARIVANDRVGTGLAGMVWRRGGTEVRGGATLKIMADLRVRGAFRDHFIPVDNPAWRGKDHMRESMTLLYSKLHQG